MKTKNQMECSLQQRLLRASSVLNEFSDSVLALTTGNLPDLCFHQCFSRSRIKWIRLFLISVFSFVSMALWAQPSTDDPDYACLNATEDYWVINTPGSNYNWILSGGGTITGGQGSSAISINWTTVGSYTLSVTETLASTTQCVGPPVVLNIIVEPLPVPTASANSPFAGDDLNLTGGPDGMAAYSWTGPNGFTSSAQNPAITGVTAAASGTYTLTVTSPNGCTASTTVDVIINTTGLPTAVANTPCAGGDLILTGGPDGMASYSWTGPNGFTSSLQNPVITGVTPAAAGTYTLTITNASGSSASVTVDVVINPLPAPDIAGANPVCESVDNSTETYSTPNVPGHTYTWTVVGGTFTGQGTNEIAVIWTTPGPGSVSVTETITSTGCSATDTVDIVIQPAPVTNGIFHN
ncbi:MAG: hypothetical protein GYA41_03790 [Bacteroidales bacterium]|nr:hypothetical protein [Bacteroidales bacterium]